MHAPAVVSLVAAALIAAGQPFASSESSPEPRSGHSIVYDSTRKKVVLVDGDHATDPAKPGEVAAWDGRRWSIVDSAAPPPRTLSAVAFDSRRGRLVVQGGLGIGDLVFGDTLEWDGAKWHRFEDPSAGGPGVRNHHAMAFDAERGVVVLFGGQDRDIRMLGDTWERSGKAGESPAWVRVATDGPAPRVHHALAYDAARKRVLLFGGSDGRRTFGDLWEWNGAKWSEIRAPGAPSPRSASRMAFDEKRRELVLFGGGPGDPGPFVFDGTAWRREAPTGEVPAARSHHAMTYDAARDRIVLFGGYVSGVNAADTWERDGTTGRWERLAPKDG